MKAYIIIFKIKFLSSIKYKTSVIFAILTQIIWGLMNIFLFNMFYKVQNNAQLTFESTRAYLWFEGIFLPLFALWMIDEGIVKSIINGDYCYELAKPIDVYWVWFFRNISLRLSKFIVRSLPVLVLAMFLPSKYNLPKIGSYKFFPFFILSTILATILLVALSMLIYILTCKFLSYGGIKSLAGTIVSFLSGGVVPLPFFPKALKMLLSFTPFPYIQNTVIKIYLGGISIFEVLFNIFMQVLWITIIVLLGLYFKNKTFEKVVVQGG